MALLATVGLLLSQTPDVSALAQYGPGGIVAGVALLACWYLLRAQQETLKLEREQNTELRAEIRELNKSIHDRYIPALTTAMAESARLAQIAAETTRALQAGKDRGR